MVPSAWSISPLSSGPDPASAADPRLVRAAREFEAFVVGRLLQSAFESGSGLLAPPGARAGPFGDMLYRALGREIAQAAGVGLADALLSVLSGAREVG